MPVSIVDIDVKDEKFKAFVELFDKYQAMLKSTPGSWNEVGKAQEGVGGGVAEMTAALLAQQELLDKHNRQMQALQRRYEGINRENEKFSRNTFALLKNVAGIAGGLVSISGVMGLLGGALGLFGLDKLAQSVSDARRSSQGLGITSGEQQAFNIGMNRYVDADRNLQAIAEAKSNYANRWAFAAMGINPNGKDPAQLGAEMALRAKQIFDRGDQSEQYAQAHGLTQFYSMEDLRRLHSVSTGELQKAVTQYRVNSRAFAMDDATQRKWQDFTVTLDTAKRKIFNVFVEDLTPLEKPLEGLAKAVADSLDTFLKNPHLKDWIAAFGSAIEKAGDYVASPKFQTDIKTFVDDIGALAAGADRLVKFLQSINVLPHGKDTSPLSRPKDLHTFAGGALNAWEQVPVLGWGLKWMENHKQSRDWAEIQSAAKKAGIPSWMLANVYGQESGFGRNHQTSSAGAVGPFQLMPATAQRYGVHDSRNFAQASEGAADYLRDLMKEFRGDARKALAAYNWGEGHVERDVKLHGADWERFLPKETKRYIDRTAPVTITVLNQTGGNANVQANQAAAQ